MKKLARAQNLNTCGLIYPSATTKIPIVWVFCRDGSFADASQFQKKHSPMSDYKTAPTKVSTLKRPAAGSYESLRGVMAGLGLMLVSLAILALLAVDGIWARIYSLPEYAVINSLLTCSVLMLVGQMICVSVPAQSKARIYAIISAICSAINCVLWGRWIHYESQGDGWSLIPIIFTQPVVGLVGMISFVLFLKNLSQYIGQSKLVKFAQLLLLFAVVSISIMGVGYLMSPLTDAILPLAGIVLATILFVFYLFLIGTVGTNIARKLGSGKV